MENKKHYLIIGLAVVMSPIIINIITLSRFGRLPVAQDNDWIGFWGSLIGSALGVVISLYILKKTYEQNAKNHRDAMTYQINSTLYLQECSNLREAEQNIGDLLKFINNLQISISAKVINAAEKLESERMCFSDLKVSFDVLYADDLEITSSEKEFKANFNKIYEYYMKSYKYRFVIATLIDCDIDSVDEMVGRFNDIIGEKEAKVYKSCKRKEHLLLQIALFQSEFWMNNLDEVEKLKKNLSVKAIDILNKKRVLVKSFVEKLTVPNK